MISRPALSLVAICLLLCSCKKEEATTGQRPPPAATVSMHKVGLVTDVGGRGDHSFNDSALRGLELWAAGSKLQGGHYVQVPVDEVQRSLPPDLLTRQPPIAPIAVSPLVVQSRAQEDYEPNLQLLVDQGAELTVGAGFMLENAVEAVARRNPQAKFLLIDSPLLDKGGKPHRLPNVRTVVFREEEGSFLVGALAGLVAKGQVGFVGGMEIPLIKKFEAGFRAGVASTHPAAAKRLIASYTGSFDNVAAGKQVAQDMLGKGVEVIFHAAGSDGLGVIQAVKEAAAGGKTVYAIGVDSDQHHLAPGAVLTSMVKRVDLAVYEAARDLVKGSLSSGDLSLGLREGGVGYAEVRLDFPGKKEALERIEALKAKVVAGDLAVPSNATELAAFKAAP